MFAPLCVCMLVSACVSECTFALLVDARAGVRNPVRAHAYTRLPVRFSDATLGVTLFPFPIFHASETTVFSSRCLKHSVTRY